MVTLEAILERNNLNRAYKQVKANRGGPGVDGMTVDELLDYLRAHAVEMVETVKAGKYKPQPVRRVMIPKEEKGKFRPLGIPTAVDRVIQQAIAQKLSDEYEPVFSLHSHGFRPCRSCRTAIDEALDIANQGYVWVVDLDLSKFFDTVNHSKLLQLLSDKLKDGRVVSLIHKILRAPIQKGECQDFCVWGGYSRGSPTRLPFVFEMQYARPDAIAGAKVEGPARSAGGSSLAPAIARREAAGALAREV